MPKRSRDYRNLRSFATAPRKWPLFPAAAPLLLLLLLFTVAGLARPKVDVIVMKNGDRLTCEIKKLEFGQLHVKTGYTLGTVVINWEKVERVESPQRFTVETTGGEYFSGLLQKEAVSATVGEGEVTVIEGSRATRLTGEEVVEIAQMEAGFLRKMDLKIDYGFTFAKANKRTQSNLQSNLQYRTEKHWAELSVSSLFAGQTDGSDTNRHNSTASYIRFLGTRKWFAVGLADFLNNDEQRLDLRTTVGGGLGRKVIHSNRKHAFGTGWSRLEQ